MNSQSLSLWPMSRTASKPTEVFVVEDIDEVFVNAWLLPNEFESLRASRLKRLSAAAPRLAPQSALELVPTVLPLSRR